jgi:hypothetical protein
MCMQHASNGYVMHVIPCNKTMGASIRLSYGIVQVLCISSFARSVQAAHNLFPKSDEDVALNSRLPH